MAVVAICAPALDWPGGRDRGREGDTTSLVRTLHLKEASDLKGRQEKFLADYHSGDDVWLLPLPSTSSGVSLSLINPWTASCVPSVTWICLATQNVGKFAGGRSAIKMTGSPRMGLRDFNGIY